MAKFQSEGATEEEAKAKAEAASPLPTKWSPFFPDDSGVSPLPYLDQASMDLQI